MKEVIYSDMICGSCGRKLISTRDRRWVCSKPDCYNGLAIDGLYDLKECPICLSGFIVLPTNTNGHKPILCRNPECLTYQIKRNDKYEYFEIYRENLHLASFTIKKHEKVNMIYNHYPQFKFCELMKEVAKVYIKRK